MNSLWRRGKSEAFSISDSDVIQHNLNPFSSNYILGLLPIMIGKGFKDYVMIRSVIFGLRAMAPASLIYLAVSIYSLKFILSTWLGVYALAEATFYLFVYIPRQYLMQKVRIHI